jgi:hypothetical protein
MYSPPRWSLEETRRKLAAKLPSARFEQMAGDVAEAEALVGAVLAFSPER